MMRENYREKKEESTSALLAVNSEVDLDVIRIHPGCLA